MRWSKFSLSNVSKCIVMSLLILLIGCKSQSGVTVELVEETIKSKVPIGSTKEEVLQFIKTSSFKSLKFDSPFQVGDIKEANPEADERTKECLAAWIDDVEKNFITGEGAGISVVFCFDENQKLVGKKIRKVYGK
jgi:hypothetical protein